MCCVCSLLLSRNLLCKWLVNGHRREANPASAASRGVRATDQPTNEAVSPAALRSARRGEAGATGTPGPQLRALVPRVPLPPPTARCPALRGRAGRVGPACLEVIVLAWFPLDAS